MGGSGSPAAIDSAVRPGEVWSSPSVLLPPLVDAHTLSASLADPRLRVFDASVMLIRPPGGGQYTVHSGLAEFRTGHLPGAGFADLAGELADPDSPFPFTVPTPERFAEAAGRLGIGPGTHVVAYSQQAPMWATRLWWLLRYFGFDAVSVLDGGLTAWRAAGLPVDDGPPGYPAARFTPEPRRALIVSKNEMQELVAAGAAAGACLVNALSPAAFRGEGPSSYSRPGRIPGSLSAPHADLVDPETSRFRDTDGLRRVLTGAGVRDGGPVVAYCGGGISATVDLFALFLLGDSGARLYDGSLTEWTSDGSLPVEVG